MKIQEPLLVESDDRFVIFPLQYPEIFSMYKTAEASFWSIEDIDFVTKETTHTFNSIAQDSYLFYSFLSSIFQLLKKDMIMSEKIIATLNADFQSTEVRFFYSFKIMAENLHKEALLFLATKLVEVKNKDLPENEKIDINQLCKNAIESEAFSARKDIITGYSKFTNKFGEFLICDELLLFGEFGNLLAIADTFAKEHKENGVAKVLLHIYADKLLHKEFHDLLMSKYIKNKMGKDKIIPLIKKLIDSESKYSGMNSFVKIKAKELLNKLGTENDAGITIKSNLETAQINDVINKWTKRAEGLLEEYRYKDLNDAIHVASGESQDFGLSEEF